LITDARGCFGNSGNFPDAPDNDEESFLRLRNLGSDLRRKYFLNKLKKYCIRFTFVSIKYIFLIEFAQATYENSFVK
jgi:hypothetical protein